MHPVKFSVANQVTVSFTTACGGTRTLQLGVNCTDYTNLTDLYCGATNINPYQTLFATNVTGATEYRFNIYDQAGTTLLTTIDSNSSSFRFYGNSFTYGTMYRVKVQVKQGSVYGVEGAACSVTLESLPTISLKPVHCGTTVNPYQWMFASSVTGASEYRFNIYDQAGTTLLTTIDRNVSFFRFHGNTFTPGTTYQVRIQVKQGSAYGAEGAACSITIFGGTYERQQVQENNNKEGIVSLVPSVLTAYPNPFTTSFVILPIAGESAAVSYQIYDVTGKLLENREINASDIKTHAIAENYAIGVYIVIIRQGTTNQTFKMIKQ